jgi:hypothetical protein
LHWSRHDLHRSRDGDRAWNALNHDRRLIAPTVSAVIVAVVIAIVVVIMVAVVIAVARHGASGSDAAGHQSSIAIGAAVLGRWRRRRRIDRQGPGRREQLGRRNWNLPDSSNGALPGCPGACRAARQRLGWLNWNLPDSGNGALPGCPGARCTASGHDGAVAQARGHDVGRSAAAGGERCESRRRKREGGQFGLGGHRHLLFENEERGSRFGGAKARSIFSVLMPKRSTTERCGKFT